MRESLQYLKEGMISVMTRSQVKRQEKPVKQLKVIDNLEMMCQEIS